MITQIVADSAVIVPVQNLRDMRDCYMGANLDKCFVDNHSWKRRMQPCWSYFRTLSSLAFLIGCYLVIRLGAAFKLECTGTTVDSEDRSQKQLIDEKNPCSGFHFQFLLQSESNDNKLLTQFDLQQSNFEVYEVVVYKFCETHALNRISCNNLIKYVGDGIGHNIRARYEMQAIVAKNISLGTLYGHNFMNKTSSSRCEICLSSERFSVAHLSEGHDSKLNASDFILNYLRLHDIPDIITFIAFEDDNTGTGTLSEVLSFEKIRLITSEVDLILEFVQKTLQSLFDSESFLLLIFVDNSSLSLRIIMDTLREKFKLDQNILVVDMCALTSTTSSQLIADTMHRIAVKFHSEARMVYILYMQIPIFSHELYLRSISPLVLYGDSSIDLLKSGYFDVVSTGYISLPHRHLLKQSFWTSSYYVAQLPSMALSISQNLCDVSSWILSSTKIRSRVHIFDSENTMHCSGINMS